MKELEAHSASERLNRFRTEFQVDILQDWGYDTSANGAWQDGCWSPDDLDRLYETTTLLANIMGGKDRITRHLGGLKVQKSDIGSHGGEALAHKVTFSKNGRFSEWTVVHELAHAWDANHGWKLSRMLEDYTGGFTSLFLARLKKRFGMWDAGPNGKESVPGRQCRKPGCNRAGYFYGDKPSGSGWMFDRKEDFAEAVAMYVGWDRGNKLTEHAHKRIKRYTECKNGEKDGFGTADNWEDYAKYFYPEQGDYTRTKRWKFVDELIKGKIAMP